MFNIWPNGLEHDNNRVKLGSEDNDDDEVRKGNADVLYEVHLGLDITNPEGDQLIRALLHGRISAWWQAGEEAMRMVDLSKLVSGDLWVITLYIYKESGCLWCTVPGTFTCVLSDSSTLNSGALYPARTLLLTIQTAIIMAIDSLPCASLRLLLQFLT